jgi:aspartyl-tRNA(Asn)/glutamyl-tRNA(Gln) amidotransferase subunit A
MIDGLPRLTAADYAGALMQKSLVWDKARTFFERYDLLLTPTMPTVAWEAGKPAPAHIAGRPIADFGYTPFTFPFNLTGQPAATVPCGFSSDGLPIGLQIVGRRLDDVTVLRACAAFEAVRPWAGTRPQIGA